MEDGSCFTNGITGLLAFCLVMHGVVQQLAAFLFWDRQTKCGVHTNKYQAVTVCDHCHRDGLQPFPTTSMFYITGTKI